MMVYEPSAPNVFARSHQFLINLFCIQVRHVQRVTEREDIRETKDSTVLKILILH